MTSKYIIKLNIQNPAGRMGIASGKELADATGFSFKAAYGFWNETSTRLDLDSLARLCEALKCNPEDLLIKTRRKPTNGTQAQNPRR